MRQQQVENAKRDFDQKPYLKRVHLLYVSDHILKRLAKSIPVTEGYNEKEDVETLK